MNVAIIPARGGSKRIPHKNIREFCGRPMISYPIEAALDTGRFDRVIVSTDSSQIATVALEYGAEVPFVRPVELADDAAPTMPVVRHALQFLKESSCDVDAAFCIYATAALVMPEDLERGIDCLESDSQLDFVLAVAEFKSHPQRALIETDGCLKFAQPEFALSQSQHLPPHFHDAGMFFGGRANKIFDCETTVGGRCAAIQIPRHRAQDIDTEEDWRFAEQLFRLTEQQSDLSCQE